LIKPLDVLLINVAIRDVSESSRSSPRPMQPNPKSSFSDENNRHRLLLTRIITWLPTWTVAADLDADVTADVAANVDDTWQPAWMTRGSLHGR
jgi:hypothetical protein